MLRRYNELTGYFEPSHWASIYERFSNYGLIFRRSAELAEEVCIKYAIKGGQWLDVGCGTGRLTVNLHRKGLSIIGIDHDAEMINYAKKTLLMKECLNLNFVIGKAESLPFENNSFDGIIAVSLMGCISSSEIVFREFNRVLRKDGMAIITFTNKDSILLKLNCYLNSIFKNSYPNKERYNIYSLTSAKRCLHDAGFSILKVRYYNFFLNIRNLIFPPERLSKLIDQWIDSKSIKMLGRNFLVASQKI